MTLLLAVTTFAQAEEQYGTLKLLYISDWLTNRDGGIQKGDRYISNIDVGATLDLDTLAGLDNAQLMIQGSYNDGTRFSSDIVGDIQAVSNIEAVDATRVYQLYYRQQAEDDRWAMLFGLWDINTEIDIVGPAGMFLNGSHGIGAEFGLSGRQGPSTFPVTALSLYGRYQFTDRFTLRTAILDGVPGDPDKPQRTTIELSRDDGALLVAEAAWSFDNAWQAKLGAWHYTSDLPRLDGGDNDEFDSGVFASVTGHLLSPGPDGTGGLSGWLRYGIASEQVQPVGRYLGGGLVYQGPIAGRPNDHAGIAFASAFASDPLRDQGAERAETSIELGYTVNLSSWLQVQPTLQYVFNPGFDSDLDNAVVMGVRFQLTTQTHF